MARYLRPIGDALGIPFVVTALPLEYDAVVRRLSDLRDGPPTSQVGYQLGVLITPAGRAVEIGVVQIPVGNLGATAATARLIAEVAPISLMFVGVAGGVKDVALGDVVVGEKVYYYEGGRGEADEIRPRADAWHGAFSLVRLAISEAAHWRQVHNFAPPYQVTVGVIAAGEQVATSTDSEVYTHIRKSYSDAVALEMEGAGFHRAADEASVDAIVIRGISDLVQDKSQSDKAGWQLLAADHAAQFAVQLLARRIDSLQVPRSPDVVSEALARMRQVRFAEFGLTPESVVATQLWELLDSFVSSNSTAMALVGPSGSGKTATTLGWLESRAAAVSAVIVDPTTLSAVGPGNLGDSVIAAFSRISSEDVSIEHWARFCQELPGTPLIVVDAPNEAGQLDHFVRTLPSFLAICAAFDVRVLVILRDTDWPLVSGGLPAQFFYSPGNADIPTNDFGLAIPRFTRAEVDDLLRCLSLEYGVTATLDGMARTHAEVPILARLFFESHRGEVIGQVHSLRDSLARFVERKISSIAVGTPSFTARWPAVRDALMNALWTGAEGRQVSSDRLEELGIETTDLQSLVSEGLLIRASEPLLGRARYSICFEAIEEWLLETWIESSLGLSDYRDALAQIKADPKLPYESREWAALVELLANSVQTDAERDLLLRVAADSSPLAFVQVATRLVRYPSSDLEYVSDFVQALKTWYVELLSRYAPPLLSLVPPFNGQYDPLAGITLWASASSGIQDLAYTIRSSVERPADDIHVDETFPQSHMTLANMKFVVVNSRRQRGRFSADVYRRLDSTRGPTPFAPELIAVRSVQEEIEVAGTSGLIREPDILLWERAFALARRLGVPDDELFSRHLGHTWVKYLPAPSGSSPDFERQEIEGQFAVLFELLDLIEDKAHYVRMPELPPRTKSGPFAKTGFAGYLSALLAVLSENYRRIVDENVGESLRRQMPIYRCVPLRVIAVTDRKNLRVLLSPQEAPDEAGGVVLLPARRSVEGTAGFGDRTLNEVVAAALAERHLWFGDTTAFDQTVSLDDLFADGIPLSNLLRRWWVSDIKSAFIGTLDPSR